ncbi:hypothetical protein COX64_00590, partial [Candidatus Dojkabacteria bacterium CG_4_10_14_0_2_um_filter_Dojkabacteria_WS6_41_15]
IVDSYNHRVLIYNNGIPTVTGATPDLVIGQPNMNSNTANNGGIGASTLNYPYDIWSDGTKLLISDQSNNRILIFNNIPTSNFASADVVIGQLDMTSNSPGTTATTLRTVRGIDSDGTKLYVADYGNHRVLVYNTIPTTNGASADIVIGQPDLTSGTVNNGGLSANTYNNPVEVQVKNGKMFVGDRANCRALIYNSIPTSNNASADVVIGQPNMTSNTCNNGGVSASSLGTTYGVVSSGTKLFVTDYTNNRILIFNSIPTVNGASADVVLGQATMTGSGFFGSTGIVTASNFYNVQGMDTDGTKLFINDYQNFRVLIYNAIPTSSGAIPDVVVGQTDLVSATSGITASKIRGAFHAIGSTILNKLFVSDGQNNRVLIFNSIPTTHGASADVVIGQADMVTSTANAGGLSAKSLNANKGVFVDATTNKLIIADASNHRVLIFNSIPTTSFASADVVIGQPNMTSNTANNGGIGPNTLNAPYGVYYDGAKLFITDLGNNRVLIFNSLPTSNNASADVVVGQPSMTSNTKNNGGVGANTLFYPRGVHSDGIRLFIADQSNHRVLIYNREDFPAACCGWSC